MEAKKVEPVEGVLVEAVKQAIATLDPYEGELAELEERIGTIVYDLDDEAQHKQARSDKHQTGKVISRLDTAHAAVKAPLLDATRRLDGRRKDIKDRLLAVQRNPKGQLEAHEAKEQARIDSHFARIQAIRELAVFHAERRLDDLEQNLEQAKATPIDDSWEEFKADALLAKTETVEALEKQVEARRQQEAEQAELLRLREEKEARERADREARIAAEAAAKAKQEAEEAAEKARLDAERKVIEERERAERERREAEKKAAREIAEANARAERAASEERERIDSLRLSKERQAAIEREVEEKRKAKQQHRAKIHGEVKAALVTSGIEEKVAGLVVHVVKDGKVPHLEIVY